MQIESLTIRTKRMIDDLKTICANFGLGGSPGEYKSSHRCFCINISTINFSIRFEK